MRIFSRAQEKEKLILVFDIRSSSVGGALFEAQKSGIPKIILSVREPLICEEKIDFKRFLFLALKSLEIVAGKICMAGLGAPDKIFCVLSSPFYISQTRIINFAKNTPFKFTAKLADNLIQKEINFLKEEHLLKHANASNKVRLIEFKNIKTTLNGYETAEPLNKTARELEMTVFISMSAEDVLGKIEEIITRHFHSREIRFSSFAMASFAVIRDLHIDEHNFLLVDIGGEVTDIFMIKKNTLQECNSFPLGCNFTMREIASSLKCSFDEAKSFISLLKDGHMVKSLAKKFQPVMEKLKIRWLKHFQESLANLSGDISVPATIYIAVDENLQDFFGEIIKMEQYSQYVLTQSKFKLLFLNLQMFHGLAVFRDNAIRDTFLIINSVYISRFLN